MGRGFGTFDSYAPQADVASTAPILELKKWLQKHIAHEGPVLGVLHLRGGHPPFDVTREAAQELPPAEYGGNLTPRRAAIQLAEIRARQSERHRQMPEEDWRRLAALQKRALLDQNVQLTHLFDWLKREGAYDDTLIVLMGDVSSGEVPLIPFAHDAPLEESFLAAPLIVKFPAGFAAGTAVPGFFAPEDVTMTLAASLGIEWPRGDAIDLSRSDAASRAAIRPHIAYRAGAYSLRLGDMILQGKDGTPPRLCQPALDVNCLVDRGEDHVLEGRALWFTLYGTLFEPLNNSRKAEVVPEDERHQSALLVWGIEP
jgi:hypothetical protein